MSLKDIQAQVDEWTSQFTPQYWKQHEILAQMQEELGEIGRILNRVYGPKPPKEGETINELGNELSDLLFAIACMANREGIDLDKEWEKTNEKKFKRDSKRFEKKE
ncbi:nucleotide pyrophosphohydrolase [Candidatus Woesearchaeota archaeon]|nr:nucleotide pyrophosphohydrolase [Candidatus Woesearchaeota archaeon]